SSSAKSKPSAARSNRRNSKNSASSPPTIRKRLKTLLQNALGSFVHLAISPSSGSVCCSEMRPRTPSMLTKSSPAPPEYFFSPQDEISILENSGIFVWGRHSWRRAGLQPAFLWASAHRCSGPAYRRVQPSQLLLHPLS